MVPLSNCSDTLNRRRVLKPWFNTIKLISSVTTQTSNNNESMTDVVRGQGHCVVYTSLLTIMDNRPVHSPLSPAQDFKKTEHDQKKRPRKYRPSGV